MFGVIERTVSTPYLVVDVPPGSIALQAWAILRGRCAVLGLYPMTPERWCCEVSPVGSAEVTVRVVYVTIDADAPLSVHVGLRCPEGFVTVGGGCRSAEPLTSFAIESDDNMASASSTLVCVRREDGAAIRCDLRDPDRWLVDLGPTYGHFVQHKPSAKPVGARAIGLASGAWLRARQPLSDDARATLSHSFCRVSKR
jgi:hypothetical protein